MNEDSIMHFQHLPPQTLGRKVGDVPWLNLAHGTSRHRLYDHSTRGCVTAVRYIEAVAHLAKVTKASSALCNDVVIKQRLTRPRMSNIAGFDVGNIDKTSILESEAFV